MKNAPLVEIIAEVRWGEGRSGSPLTVSFGGDDSLYVKFGIGVGRHGYERLERVLPAGIPVQAGTVVYRYRRADDEQNTLFQLGHGVFTANGLPPYNSWKEFEPYIRKGLDELLAVSAFDKTQPIELILRYVDAFDERLLAGVTSQEFIETVVGVPYRVTGAVSKIATDEMPQLRFNAVHATKDGGSISIEVGDGMKDGKPVLVLNTAAVSPQFVPGDADEIMHHFAALQDVLHDMFFEMIGRNEKLRSSLTQNGG